MAYGYGLSNGHVTDDVTSASASGCMISGLVSNLCFGRGLYNPCLGLSPLPGPRALRSLPWSQTLGLGLYDICLCLKPLLGVGLYDVYLGLKPSACALDSMIFFLVSNPLHGPQALRSLP